MLTAVSKSVISLLVRGAAERVRPLPIDSATRAYGPSQYSTAHSGRAIDSAFDGAAEEASHEVALKCDHEQDHGQKGEDGPGKGDVD